MVSLIGVHGSVDTLFPPMRLSDAIAEAGPRTAVVPADAGLDDCDALVTLAFEEAFLEADLNWIHSVQSGVDRFPFERLRDRGIALTNSTGIHGDAVGETVVGYMLQFARRLHVHRDNEADRRWRHPAWDEAFTLDGEPLCVVGLGTLGRGIAARAAVLGMDVVGVNRTPVPVDFVSQVYTPDRLETAVGTARFVAVAVPLTEDTRGLIDAEAFGAMRPDAYLLDVSRGGVVDEAALLAALDGDRIAGAARDVFETEPLPPDSPFWDRPEVIVTPHAASATIEYLDRVAALVAENARRVGEGRELANVVV